MISAYNDWKVGEERFQLIAHGRMKPANESEFFGFYQDYDLTSIREHRKKRWQQPKK